MCLSRETYWGEVWSGGRLTWSRLLVLLLLLEAAQHGCEQRTEELRQPLACLGRCGKVSRALLGCKFLRLLLRHAAMRQILLVGRNRQLAAISCLHHVMRQCSAAIDDVVCVCLHHTPRTAIWSPNDAEWKEAEANDMGLPRHVRFRVHFKMCCHGPDNWMNLM